MHDLRASFACAALDRCIIVAGGEAHRTIEVYDKVLDRWLRLPCDLPCHIGA
jgi:very-short-patch-repair endonuclease